jgi:glutathione S-transferase
MKMNYATAWPGSIATTNPGAEMTHYKLTYFDFDGGRGEPIRLAMSIGHIEFEDYRFPLSEFSRVAPATPFRQVPTLEVDGEVITQTNAILRYAGKLSGLYPEDALQALYCDEVMDALNDILARVSVTFRMDDEEEKRLAREALATGPIPLYVKGFGKMLEDRGGDWFADDRLTIADLRIFLFTRNLTSGQLDHVPTDIVEKNAPNLLAHLDRVTSHPAVAAYYERRSPKQ